MSPHIRAKFRKVTKIINLAHNNHIYSTLFKTQERESDRRSKEIDQRKESHKKHIPTKQQGHVTQVLNYNLLH